jgi:hypothetical protein
MKSRLSRIKNFNVNMHINKPLIQLNFILITSKEIESIAINFSGLIKGLGYPVKISYTLTTQDCYNSTESDIYIIIHSDAKHGMLPKKFIVFQVEQTTSPWFTESYFRMLSKSWMVWDFSLKNIEKYKDIVPEEKIFFNPMPFLPIYIENNQKTEYDLFFYGVANVRREKILNELGKKYNLKIGFRVYGKGRDEYIQKSKIILNLHYYPDAALETCRINEILNYDKIIISEYPSHKDSYNIELYKNLVIFVDEIKNDFSNLDLLIKTINFYLDETNYIEYIENIKKNKRAFGQQIKELQYKNFSRIIPTLDLKTHCE